MKKINSKPQAKKKVAQPAREASSASTKVESFSSNFDKRRSLAFEKGTPSYKERRSEIAKAAAQIFNKLGFRGTSIVAVAKALGTSRASLYYYISSKQELFDEVVREAIETNLSIAEGIRDSNVPAVEKIRLLIIALMRSYGTHYPLLYIYIRENLTRVESTRTEWSNEIRDLNRRYESVFISIIQDGIGAGTIRPVASPKLIAYGLIGMVGWTNRWFVPKKSAETAEQIGASYAELVLGGLMT